MSTPSEDAEQASRINTELFNKYADLGIPALRGAIGRTQAELAGGGMPGYVNRAYDTAAGGALEASVLGQNTARGRLLDTASGGAALQGLTSQGIGTAANYASEIGKLRTSQAAAGIDQKNKLLGLLTGQGATGTNLAQGFGQLTNQGLGMLGSDPGAYPYIAGGLSGIAGAYNSYLVGNQQQNQWQNMYDQNTREIVRGIPRGK